MFPGLTKFRCVSFLWYFVNFLMDYTETGVISEDLYSPLTRKPCTTGEKKTPNHSHCGSFYTCSGAAQWLIHFCTFPQLFSNLSNKCLPFELVNCDERYEPKTPCGYRQANCRNELDRCVCRNQQDIDYNFCRNRADGFYPAKPTLSPLYIECNKERTLPKRCEDAYFVFNQEKKKCLNIFVLVYPHLLLNATLSISSPPIPSSHYTISRVTFEPIDTIHVTESGVGQDHLTEESKLINLEKTIFVLNSYRNSVLGDVHLSNSMIMPSQIFQSQYDVSVSYQRTLSALSSNSQTIQTTRTSPCYNRESSGTEERSMANMETPVFLTLKKQYVTLSDSFGHSERFRDDATTTSINSEHLEESILLITPNLPKHADFSTFETNQGPESVNGWSSYTTNPVFKLSALSQVTPISTDYQQANAVTDILLHSSPSDIEFSSLLFSKPDQLKSYSNSMINPTPEFVNSEAVPYKLQSPTVETSHFSQSSSKGLYILPLIKQTSQYTSNKIIRTLDLSPEILNSKHMLTYHRQTSQNYLSDKEIKSSVETQFLLSSAHLDKPTFHITRQLTKTQQVEQVLSNARFGFHTLEADISKSVSDTSVEGSELPNEAYHITSSHLDGISFIKIITDGLQNTSFLTSFLGSSSTAETTFIKPTPSSFYHMKTHLSELSNEPNNENPFLGNSFVNEHNERISLRTREQASSIKNSLGTGYIVSRQTSLDSTFTDKYVFSDTSYLNSRKPESTYLTSINSGQHLSSILSPFDTEGDMSKQPTADHVSSVIAKLKSVHASTYEIGVSTEIHLSKDVTYQKSKRITSSTIINTNLSGYASAVTKTSELDNFSTDAAQLNSRQSLSSALTGDVSFSDVTSVITGRHLSAFTTSITDNTPGHLIGENSVDILTDVTKFCSGQYISTVKTDIAVSEGTTSIDITHTAKHISTVVSNENTRRYVSVDGTFVYKGNQESATSSNIETLVHGHASSANGWDRIFADVTSSITRDTMITYITRIQKGDQSFLDITSLGTNYMTHEHVYRNSISHSYGHGDASNIWVTESIPNSKGTVTTITRYLSTAVFSNNARYHNTGIPIHIESTLSSNDKLVMGTSEYPTEPLPFKTSETHIHTNGVDNDWEKSMAMACQTLLNYINLLFIFYVSIFILYLCYSYCIFRYSYCIFRYSYCIFRYSYCIFVIHVVYFVIHIVSLLFILYLCYSYCIFRYSYCILVIHIVSLLFILYVSLFLWYNLV